ncbi:DUF6036 family nucleotidyltransferase [soil metagenome]
MTKKEILLALETLNERLAASDTKAEISLYGGTSMVLAFNARLSTRDVDAVFHPKQIVRKAAESVAEELQIEKSWLNDGVKGFLSENADLTEQDLPQYTHLQVTRPTASYLLAMKCMAARAPGYDTKGDREDIMFLLRRLKISTEKSAFDLVEQYYPRERIAPKTNFMILECLAELNHGRAKKS